MWKRGEINFSSFPQYFQYISSFRSQITYSFMKCGCFDYLFSSILQILYVEIPISRSISDSSLDRDNESRLYFVRMSWFALAANLWKSGGVLLGLFCIRCAYDVIMAKPGARDMLIGHWFRHMLFCLPGFDVVPV